MGCRDASARARFYHVGEGEGGFRPIFERGCWVLIDVRFNEEERRWMEAIKSLAWGDYRVWDKGSLGV